MTEREMRKSADRKVSGAWSETSISAAVRLYIYYICGPRLEPFRSFVGEQFDK